MMNPEYRLSYTANEIDEKLGKIDILEEALANAGGGSGSGAELVGTWIIEEEVASMTVELDSPLDASYLVEFDFVGTATNDKGYKPIIYVNGYAFKYLSKEALYASNMCTTYSFGYLKGLKLLFSMHDSSFLFGGTASQFNSSSYMATPYYNVQNHNYNSILTSVGIYANGGVFGIGTAIRIFKINSI